MALKLLKQPAIILTIQASVLKSYFPESTYSINNLKLVWKGKISPSELSDEYEIKLIYSLNEHPNVYVINKKLSLAEGHEKLPHIYGSNENQNLCLYFRQGREWGDQMLIAKTILPWTSEWLWFYENWLATGKWMGRGIH